MILNMISLQKNLLKRIVPKVGVRNIYTNSILKKNFYETLGVSRNATQAEIKNAYFELSKLYHPDRIAATDENLAKFREISAAYEILGNEQSRKLYDRGLLGHEKGIDESDEIIDPIIKFYQKRQDLSKSLSKSSEDVEAWAKTYFKDDKARIARRQMIHKVIPKKEFEPEQPFRDAFQFGVLLIVMFLFLSNYEDSRANRIWKKIFNNF